MTDNLALKLYETGLFQTGLFTGDALFQFRLDMLAAYPDVLQQIIDEMIAHVNVDAYERLVCLPDAMPLCIGLALQTKIPMVYSRGRGEAARFDLVGAYDVGHPTCLIVNILRDGNLLRQFVRKCESVGLNVQHIIGVVDTGIAVENLKTHSLLNLSNIVTVLHEKSLLSERQRQAILKPGWLARK